MAEIKLYNMDCMEAMKSMPDNAFELAICDPPYGIGMDKMRVYNDGKRWDTKKPEVNYFLEIKRISQNYIIWGGNYFKELFPCSGYIIWDKHQPEGLTFGMVEMAATSFNMPSKMYFTKPVGERGFYTVDGKRIHPTQKPVALYKWLLKNYAKQGDRILDTHLGSGSIAIACYDLGFDLEGYEIDKEYFDAAKARLDKHMAQGRLFEPVKNEPMQESFL